MTAEHPVGIVVLAAGESARLGSPKQLIQYEGQSLLRRALGTAIDAAVWPVGVVIGAHEEQVAVEAEGLDVQIIVNDRWQSGMGSSISCGCRAISAKHDYGAIILMPCDMPRITTDLLYALIDAHRAGHPIVACAYSGTLGPPVLFDKRFFPALEALSGPGGAKRIISAHLDVVHSIDFDGGEIDIDTPAEYEQLRSRTEASI